jgi:hypothetical protein
MKEFKSIDEIYFYMKEMFTEGFSEGHINKALDIFMRDAEKFEEKDLENEVFEEFIREIGVGIQVYSKEATFLKIGQFMDLFVISDPILWINLELVVI